MAGTSHVYTRAATAATRTVPAVTALTPPAGGTGAAAGGYDTAGNRDLMIASQAALVVDVAATRALLNTLIADLQANGIIG